MCSTLTRRSRAGSTGQPGRQVAPSSAVVTGCTVPPVGAGGALADDDADDGDADDGDADDGDGITAGDDVAAGGGSAEVHCTSTTPAASIPASTAPRRLKDVNEFGITSLLTPNGWSHRAEAGRDAKCVSASVQRPTTNVRVCLVHAFCLRR